jgi:hypothetical protein
MIVAKWKTNSTSFIKTVARNMNPKKLENLL